MSPPLAGPYTPPPLALSEKRAVASHVPSRGGQVRIAISGPQVGSWALRHMGNDLRPYGFVVLSGGPEFTVRYADQIGAYGPTMVAGQLELGLVLVKGDYANSFEAAQVALERLAQLPDAKHLANVSLRIEIEIQECP